MNPPMALRRAVRQLILLAMLSSSSVVSAAAAADSGPAYHYAPGTKAGPENWFKLSPKYSACNGGGAVRKQSPIDIITKSAVPKPDLDPLTRTYVASDATLVNDGKHISMLLAGKPGTVTIGGKAFGLKKLRWHTPSEHLINGKRHPLELQMMHESESGSGEVAIIAILYKVGKPDSFVVQLKKKLAELAGDKCKFYDPAATAEEARVAAGTVHLRSLQKRTGSYFRYAGSLTQPPCSEGVIWNVLGKIRQVSQEQLDSLTAPLPLGAQHNARPVQPINGRVVTFYNPPNSTISFEM